MDDVGNRLTDQNQPCHKVTLQRHKTREESGSIFKNSALFTLHYCMLSTLGTLFEDTRCSHQLAGCAHQQITFTFECEKYCITDLAFIDI
ncbi:Protein of unknown function [Gryllus bimaculatus]|nr:Protein of unknown function [Gryllus bimaculatus]